jgi:lysophospholipase L1-like esterase
MKVRVLLAAAVVALAAVPAAAAVPPPSSIASTGDSITRAFNTGSFPLLDAPSNSWSTGSNASVNSHYRRLLALNPAISGRAYNVAQSGADMADLNGQAQLAVALNVQYVTVLMGANDVCASSEAAMTPVSTFRAQFEAAMETVTSGSPQATVFVVSIPDVYRLWQIWHTDANARLAWRLTGFCKSMLARPGSTAPEDMARRERVREREIAYNRTLADVCALFAACTYDGGAVFSYRFERKDVSTRDYFHPSLEGQRVLAAVTWAAGPFGA